jgi:hypothetical protein
MCNTNVTEEDILKVFSRRIYLLSAEKWFIKKFCTIQYGTDFLNSTNKAVGAAHKLLEENNIIEWTGRMIPYEYGSKKELKERKEYTLLIPYQYPIDTLLIPYQYPIDTPKEQEQEQDKIQDKIQDQEKYKNIVKDNVQEQENNKKLAERIIDILSTANSDDIKYDRAVEAWNKLGGIENVASIMEWDSIQTKNWKSKLDDIYYIKNQNK